MTRLSVIVLLLVLLALPDLFGQSGTDVEMADVLRRDGKIYTVVAGLTLILTALIFFMIRVDKKIFRLDKRMKE